MEKMSRFWLVFSFCLIITCTPIISQDTEERSVELEAYHSIDVSGGIDVYITQGNRTRTLLKADEAIIDLIESEVQNETLYLNLGKYKGKIKVLEAHLTMPSLRSIAASGSSDVYSNGLVEIKDLVINASGASDIELEIQGSALAATMAGSSDLDLKGSVQDMTCVANGSSDINAKTFEVQNCILTLNGASDAVIGVSKKLSVEAHGASDVLYYGDPEIVHQVAKGASSIQKS